MKIKSFLGSSANALKIQVWTALLAMLVLRSLQFKSRWAWAFSHLVRLLRLHLFSHRNLWHWLEAPDG